MTLADAAMQACSEGGNKLHKATAAPLTPIAQCGEGWGMSCPDDLSIRLRRAAFNRALTEADLAAIGRILAPDIVLVTGTDSAVIAGRKAQLQAWKREFAARSRIVYVRMPDTIVVSPVEPIALEHGKWHGTSSADAEVIASGDYSAKWRKAGEDWIIEAEIFVTLA